MTAEVKADLVAGERDGIKFQYIPLKKSNVEGQVSFTTLRAIKGISSYEMEIRENKIGEILPITGGNIDIFNRVIIQFLGGSLECSCEIKVQEEKDITINIKFEILKFTQELCLVLEHEKIGEAILLRRKVDYLTEKVREYEETKMHYMYMGMQKIFNISNGTHRNIDWKEIVDNVQPVNNLTKYGKELLESKTEGFFKEISNYDLLKLLEQSENYRKCVERNIKIWPHSPYPLLHYYEYMCVNLCSVFETYLLIINKMGYELIEINSSYIFIEPIQIIGMKIKPSKIKHNYIIEKYDWPNSMIPDDNLFYTTVKICPSNTRYEKETNYSIKKVKAE